MVKELKSVSKRDISYNLRDYIERFPSYTIYSNSQIVISLHALFFFIHPGHLIAETKNKNVFLSPLVIRVEAFERMRSSISCPDENTLPPRRLVVDRKRRCCAYKSSEMLTRQRHPDRGV